MNKHTEGPWFVSGVRFRMNGGEWHSVNHYNEELKKDENIACVGFDPRTGKGLSDARLISAAPELLKALQMAVRQNSHDMQMTGEELRLCEKAISKAMG